MARYIVSVAAGGRRATLLVVLSPSQLCSALFDTVKSRLPTLANKLAIVSTRDIMKITLHLNAEDGPLLDVEDLLSDVLPDPKKVVFAVVDTEQAPPNSPSPSALSPSSGNTLRIRVITPESAQPSTKIDAINPLPTHVPVNYTLKQLKGLVQESLAFPADDGTCDNLECNCSFARQIDTNATLNAAPDAAAGNIDALHNVIVVHSDNNVVALTVGNLTLNTIQQAAKDHLPRNLTARKAFNIVGGVEDTTVEIPRDKRYLKAPVLAICSAQRHTQRQVRHSEGRPTTSASRELILDIHTSECPLEITAHNANTTIAASGLEDCAVNGVLNIFAVRTETAFQGKAGIFKKSEAWEHHIGQTDRGISSLLSTLRVFTSLTSEGNMESIRQDAVLHMIHLLTRFPPAVRAAHILMRGETPGLPERAALAQCLYEVLKIMVPLQTIRSDPKRFFEGSRLLFGLILEKAKHMKVSNLKDDSELPYVGMKVYDLRNSITMDPVLSEPMQTKSGLINLGCCKAFEDGGLLTWANDSYTQKGATLDQAWDRIAIVSGGTKTHVVAYNADAIRTSARYIHADDVGRVITPAEYIDLTYLANLCSRNQLSVTPPAALASASAPVLTMDREGPLAVYVGRAVCAEAGKDTLIFRPISTTEEENVDVSIITQLLEPILTQRKADGTIVFEAYGDHHRKLTAPNEIIMICVDLSSSMRERCGFEDVQSSEDADAEAHRHLRPDAGTSNAPPGENPAFQLLGPDELKEYLKAHESFDDFLAIVGTGRNDDHRCQNAEKVLQILQQLHQQQIEAEKKMLEGLQANASQWAYRTEKDRMERNINTLQNRSSRLHKYKDLLCAWLITCLGKAGASDLLLWSPGDDIPKVYKTITATDSPKFEILGMYCCPIGGEPIQDPVITVDNYTYERKNIERWLQTNKRSPLTGLAISTDLRPNIQIQEKIVSFLNSSDITSKYANANSDSIDTSNTLRVTFRSPLETRSMDLPRDTKTIELWEIAFRLRKAQPIGGIINPAFEVFITSLDLASTNEDKNIEELCLVKVYEDLADDPIVSYWLPKNTTKTLTSVVFRYYHQRFTTQLVTPVEDPFVFWIRLRDIGDSKIFGRCVDKHWDPISGYFNAVDSTGNLSMESCVAMLADDDEVPDDDIDLSGATSNHPCVLKLSLDTQEESVRLPETTLSRLDVLKQMFDAYINRLLAYNFQTHIGLVTFSTKASVSQKITHAVENFRHKLNNMSAAGDTAMWNSITLAQDQLQQYAEQYPATKLRIICISDGEDNRSDYCLPSLSSSLIRNGVVVDFFCLGRRPDYLHTPLKAVSCLTGGYFFEPNSLEEAMAICEMEPVLSCLERPDNSTARETTRDRFRALPNLHNFNLASKNVVVERVGRDSFLPRKQHPQLTEAFVELGHVSKSTSANRTNTNARHARIQNEIRNSGAKPHPNYDVYICESHMGLWKVAMQGPPDSTYADGTFILYVEMGDSYPISPPTARFITPIYHPNINRHGHICHSILDRNWTLDTSTKDVIDTIYSLLLVPEFSDPINTVVTLNYHWDQVQFKEEAQRHIERHASKSRAAWRSEIVG
ncbi:hypothetical protein BDW02DRAFT_599244 [Decorospora gaudefroyi]|uniref:peptidylprolyl isomerase n=1 Tax=Decorospora gaudefroyi TaxID=184978 RepID=A0A6A5KBC9_9PLEO|nr:hypothetical protein BDW02DRAFT_599244 [Decorospora gaudefroyi]